MGIRVQTKSGIVEGAFQDGVHAFLGLPYAAPPVGKLRFCPPVRPVPWDGVRDATAYGSTAPQSKYDGLIGDLFGAELPPGDDFLNLNVWTPEVGAANLPVFVWIHGGSFLMGSGSDATFNGTAFAKDGVVAVTINYRLGVQGFLYIEGEEGAGNLGILDQAFALQWVRENIAAFGGDPDKVTIAGQSAGGMSVGTLMALPAAKGLFRRAIAQSGGAHNGMDTGPARGVANYFANILGADPQDADALRNIPLDRLLEAEKITASQALSRQEPSFGELGLKAVPMAFQPVYHTKALPNRPIDAVRQGSAKGVDLLVGTTAEEILALMKADAALLGIAPGEDMPWEAVDMSSRIIFEHSPVSTAEALELYRRNRPQATNFEIMCAVQSDWSNRIPAIRLAEAQLQYSSSVYTYVLSWKSNNEQWSAGHCLDLPLVFDTCDSRLGKYLTGGNVPPQVVNSVHGAWVEFIKTGRPKCRYMPEWLTYDLKQRHVMRIDLENTLLQDPEKDERILWEPVGIK